MEPNGPCGAWPLEHALWERSYRRGVAADRAVSAGAATTWPAAPLADALDNRGDLLRAAVGVSMAASARQLSAVANGLPVVFGAA